MKVRVHDDVPVYGGLTVEVKRVYGAYKAINKYDAYFGLKEVDLIEDNEADVVEEVKKSCIKCSNFNFKGSNSYCSASAFVRCPHNDYSEWKPKDDIVDHIQWVDNQESPTITAFRQIMDDKIKLAIAKNNDYGNSVDKIWDTLTDNGHDPYISLYIRLADKFHRFENLAVMKNKQQVKDESVMDTLADLSNYVDLFRGWKLRRDSEHDTTA